MESNEKPEHLEEIRDIIFGPQKREFENRVRTIQAQIESTKTQFALLIQELNTSFLNQLRTMTHSLEDKLNQVEERGNTNRLELMQHTQQLEARFTTSIQSVIHTSAERFASLDVQLTQLRERFNEQLQQSDERREASVAQILGRIRHERDDFTKLLDTARLAAEEQNALLAQQLKLFGERAASDRAELMNHLDQVETRFDKSVQNAIQTAAEKIGALDLRLNSMQKTLQEDLSTLRADMGDLDSRTTELTNSKVSRDAMAETLMELARRIQGGERLKLISQPKTNKS